MKSNKEGRSKVMSIRVTPAMYKKLRAKAEGQDLAFTAWLQQQLTRLAKDEK